MLFYGMNRNIMKNIAVKTGVMKFLNLVPPQK